MANKKEKPQQLQNDDLQKMLEEKSAALELMQREATIEVALEKVRARTMAMQHSDELADAAQILFQQVTELGVHAWTSGFQLWDEDRNAVTVWTSTKGVLFPSFKMPTTEDPLMIHIVDAAQKGETLHVEDMGGEVLANHYKYMSSLPSLQELFKRVASSGHVVPAFQINHAAFFSNGYLLFITHEPCPEAHDIFKRFAKVFEQTYTRFLDLQKAEAQARESQIELGLERVRARAMAMQNSEELKELIGTVFTELTKLDLVLTRCVIMIFDPKTNGSTWWMANSEDAPNPMGLFVKYHELPSYLAYIKAWKERKIKWQYVLEGKIKNEWDNYIFSESELSQLPDFVIAGMRAPERVYLNVSFNNFGNLTLASLEPLSNEHFDILLRFAKAFDLTYTRFNDLQKAEAQAREAQIELGLERVRARAMAMQKSDELSELVDTVFKELTKLDFALTWCIINIIDESSMSNTVWAANPDINKAPESYHMLFEDYPFHHAMMKGWKERKTKYVYVLEGSEKKIYDEYLFNETEFRKVPEAAQAASRAIEKYVVSFSFSNFGGLQTVGDEPLSDANLDILSRFGKVFDLTYTRFNDLKQAEAQAKESQIQLALERVRARTMAMQRSEELPDTAILLTNQVKELGVQLWGTSFQLWDEDKKEITVWSCIRDTMISPFKVPATEDPLYINIFEASRKGESLYAEELGGEVLENHTKYMMSFPGFREGILSVFDQGSILPASLMYNVAYFSNGFVLYISLDPCPEAHDTFKRFAKVFEQTYTRFLDLQKAEVQAREAQIEAALEKIRSRSLAMHKSEELKDVVVIMFEKMKELDVILDTIAIQLFDQNTMNSSFWLSNDFGIEQHLVLLPYDEKLMKENNYLKDCWEAKANSEDMINREYSFEQKNSYFDYVFANNGLDAIPLHVREFIKNTKSHICCLFIEKNSTLFADSWHGQLYNEEKLKVLKRAARVFEQAYVRFLDLQKSEAQAREAQIQLAMERVRARTMAMQKSDELAEAASLLFKQIEDLGTTSWSSGFDIWLSNEASATAWMANPDGSIGKPFVVPYTEDPFFKQIYAAKQSGTDFFVMESSGKELEETYEYLFNLPDAKKHFDGVKSLGFQMPAFQITHCAFFSQGFLMFITYEPVPEMWDIFKRFAVVFEQTYTRFLDLQKAEAQAREARIEAALEKVRGRTMAMHKSDELLDSGALLYRELTKLGIDKLTSGFMLIDEDEKMGWNYGVNPSDGQIISQPIGVPLNETKVLRSIVTSWKKQEPLHILQLDPQETIAHQTFMAENAVNFPITKEKLLAITPERLVIHTFNFKHGYLIIVGGVLLTTEQQEMVVRFAKVFEMTYRRFLDLKQAEAQAREARIEAALEKVRSRSLAMHKSDELESVVSVVFEKLRELDVAFDGGVGIIIFTEGSRDAVIWVASPDHFSTASCQNLPYEEANFMDNPILLDMWIAREKGIDFYIGGYSFEEKNIYFKYLFKHNDYKHMPPHVRDWLLATESYTHSVALAKNSAIVVNSWIGQLLSENENEIVKRFAKVFEQAYIRFLDLQKAEAQAREAQIEAALERVRSRSMGMQKSEELRDVIQVIFDQLIHLNFNISNAGFGTDYKLSDDIDLWMADAYEKYPAKIHIPYFDHPLFNDFIAAREKGLDFFTCNLSFEEKNKWMDHVLKYIPAVAEETKASVYGSPGFAHSAVLLKNVSLYINNLSGIPYSDAENATLMRFGKVFEQTYTRFNDLKQAESQTREAKIEAALEKVRARTMAMQKSDELKNAAALLFQQVKALGAPAYSCGYNIWEKDEKQFTSWMSTQDGSEINGVPNIPLTEDANFIRYVASKQNGEQFFVLELRGERMQEHYNYLKTIPAFKAYFEYAISVGFDLPETQIHHLANFSQGNLLFITLEPCPEFHDVFKRFAAVFEQTYTRFLDLQNAETQARESQIQLALERVRSRAMAMYHSEELNEVLSVLIEQFDILGIQPVKAVLSLFDMEKNTFSFRTTGKAGKRIIGEQIFDINSNDVFKEIAEIWKNSNPNAVFTNFVSKEDLPVVWQLFPNTFANVPEDAWVYPTDYPDGLYNTFGYCKFGFIGFDHTRPATKEEEDITIRFANEFERLYQRFLDLQKAEAQAKEAQIQLAMERVRARTMAMQHSDELADAASLLFKQVSELGIKLWSTAFQIWNADDISSTAWASAPDGSIQAPFRLPYNEDIFFKQIYKARKKGEALYVMESSGKELEETYHYMFNLPGVKKYFDDAEDSGFAIPTFQITHCAFFSHGYLMFITYEPVPEMWNIFERFAKVFEQTYTRFLDLQKAEAQAREAEIELSLERIRSKAMAMHGSGDILATTTTAFEELQKLGIHSIRCGIGLLSKNSMDAQVYASATDSNRVSQTLVGIRNMNDHPSLTRQYQSWLKQENFVEALHDEELKSYYNKLFFQSSASTTIPQSFDKKQYGYYFSFADGLFYSWSDQPYSDNEINILTRFNAIVALTFRRFLDLQKAEAQAREAEIQLGLERVRARAMAMQTSEELNALIGTVFTELTKLDLTLVNCDIIIFDSQTNSSQWWLVNSGAPTEPLSCFIKYHQHPPYLAIIDGWKQRKLRWVYDLKGNIKKEWDDFLFNETELSLVPSDVIANMTGLESVLLSSSFNNFGCLNIATREPLSEEHFDILLRFTKVFDLTYTRFNDLKQAEAQAREAQIQLALERVRARTMAMQKSDELTDVAGLLFEQVSALGIKTWTAGFNVWSEDNNSYVDYITSPNGGFIEPYTVHTETAEALRDISDARKSGVEFDVQYVEGEKIRQLYLALTRLDEKQYEIMLQDGVSFPSHQYEHFVFGSKVSLMFITYEPVPVAHDIFKRLGKVFEQTYTRFLDLQKAEAQAREAKIEAALERVRSRSMAMHQSTELTEVADVLFQQLRNLGGNLWGCGFVLCKPGSDDDEVWFANENGVLPPITIPHTKDPTHKKMYEGWKNKMDLFTESLEGPALKDHYDYMVSVPSVNTFFENIITSGLSFPTKQTWHAAYFKYGYMLTITLEAYPDEQVFVRFAKVFDQTYTRFLDLQKAEAQAREAQIQLALERVRARTMAMQKSDELAEVSSLLFQQLDSIGVKSYSSGFTIWDSDRHELISWMCNADSSMNPPFRMPIAGDTWHSRQYESWKNGEDFIFKEMAGEEMQSYFRYLRSFHLLNEAFEKSIAAGHSMPEKQVHNVVNFANGNLLFITLEPCLEAHDIFKRFTKVFEQTYTRFLDLQKAEAQAREARIEAALEKVRSRSMAMHKSEELRDVVKVVFDKLQELNFVLDDGAVGILIFKEGSNDHTQWMVDPDHLYATSFEIPFTDHSIPTDLINAKKSGADYFSKIYPVEEKNEYFKYLFAHADYKHLPGEVKDLILGSQHYGLSVAFAKNSAIVIPTNSGKLLADDEKEILKRFVKVFDQAYTRFLDLQKAEAQAREAKIEAALEKVRSRTMAMQRSDELANVATVLFQQVKALGVPQWTCGFSIFEIDDKEFTWYPGSADGDILPPVKIPLTEHPVFISFNDSRKRGDELFVYEKVGEFQADHYRYMRSLPGGEEMYQNTLKAGLTLPTFQIDHLANFSHGNLMFITYEPFPEMHDVFKRFAKVFEQTYTRFLDLQRAEAQVLEAVKRASVDRVRAEIASMRTTNDLERITPLIWRELTTIGVPFIRCGVFIMDEEQQQVHTFLSTPDGAAIAAFHQPYNAPGETAKIIAHWQKKKIYKQHWDEAQFIEFTKNLEEQGAITSGGKYLVENRPTNLDLHFLPFMQGMLYVGNTAPLSNDELQLVQNLADAFSTAYARYEDFNKLESAKEQIEKTLVDLKQAQAQLVQSAKMASLGELTAGIAHEIQNPLNFVNNFSEVNTELIAEMKEEMDKGNMDDAKAIADDIADNEEKINHHGKRADAIVKGMLQHSRSSTDKKEATNINTLADEYLRLAYHGLRAKDKSFNATLKTDFDESIQKIDIIPQDIGRVILNLITNAFYTVAEKKRQQGDAYEPTVYVSTKNNGDGVQILVRDNGNGIPEKVVDKIFQPFFTTKPTGQGTGLGLSLAYDIVKTHGGDLTVKSNEGEGSEFIISIPVV